MLGGSIEHKFGKNEWERNEDVVQEYHESGQGSSCHWMTDTLLFFILQEIIQVVLTVSSSHCVLWTSDIAPVSGG